MSSKQKYRVAELNLGPSDRKFKFQSFSERIAHIDVDVFHRVGRVDAEPSKEAHSWFRERLWHWDQLNLTTQYKQLSSELSALCVTLPELLFHKNAVVDLLIDAIEIGAEKEHGAVEAALDLLATLSRDLRHQTYEYFDRILMALSERIDPQDPSLLEAIFECLGFLIKFLQRQLVDDLPRIYRLYATHLLTHKRQFVRMFAAESLAFLMRKRAGNWPRFNALLREHVFDAVPGDERERSLYVDGVASVLFATVKGVQDNFHSRMPVVLQLLLRIVPASVDDAGDDDEACIKRRATVAIVRATMERMAEHTSGSSIGARAVWHAFDDFLSKRRNTLLDDDDDGDDDDSDDDDDDNGVVNESVVMLLLDWVSLRKGERVLDVIAPMVECMVALVERVPAARIRWPLLDLLANVVLVACFRGGVAHAIAAAPALTACVLAVRPVGVVYRWLAAIVGSRRMTPPPELIASIRRFVYRFVERQLIADDVGDDDRLAALAFVSEHSASLASERWPLQKEAWQPAARILQARDSAASEQHVLLALDFVRRAQVPRTEARRILFALLACRPQRSPLTLAETLRAIASLHATDADVSSDRKFVGAALSALADHPCDARVLDVAARYVDAAALQCYARSRPERYEALAVATIPALRSRDGGARLGALRILCSVLDACGARKKHVRIVELLLRLETCPRDAIGARGMSNALLDTMPLCKTSTFADTDDDALPLSPETLYRAVVNYCIGIVAIRFTPLRPAIAETLAHLARCKPSSFALIFEPLLNTIEATLNRRYLERRGQRVGSDDDDEKQAVDDDDDDDDDGDDDVEADEKPTMKRQKRSKSSSSSSKRRGKRQRRERKSPKARLNDADDEGDDAKETAEQNRVDERLDEVLWAVLEKSADLLSVRVDMAIALFSEFWRSVYEPEFVVGVRLMIGRHGAEDRLKRYLRTLLTLRKRRELVDRHLRVIRDWVRALLCKSDHAVQLLALDCLAMLHVDDLKPYVHRLRRIANDGTMREELTQFELRADVASPDIEPAHRAVVTDALLRILYGKMYSRGRSSKESPERRRAMLFSTLAVLSADELGVLFDLLMSPATGRAINSMSAYSIASLLQIMGELVRHMGLRVTRHVPKFVDTVLACLAYLETPAAASRMQSQPLRRMQTACIKRIGQLADRFPHSFDASESGTLVRFVDRLGAQHVSELHRISSKHTAAILSTLLKFAAHRHLSVAPIFSRGTPSLLDGVLGALSSPAHPRGSRTLRLAFDIVSTFVNRDLGADDDDDNDGDCEHKPLVLPVIGSVIEHVRLMLAKGRSDSFEPSELELVGRLAPFIETDKLASQLLEAMFPHLASSRLPRSMRSKVIGVATSLFDRVRSASMRQAYAARMDGMFEAVVDAAHRRDLCSMLSVIVHPLPHDRIGSWSELSYSEFLSVLNYRDESLSSSSSAAADDEGDNNGGGGGASLYVDTKRYGASMASVSSAASESARQMLALSALNDGVCDQLTLQQWPALVFTLVHLVAQSGYAVRQAAAAGLQHLVCLSRRSEALRDLVHKNVEPIVWRSLSSPSFVVRREYIALLGHLALHLADVDARFASVLPLLRVRDSAGRWTSATAADDDDDDDERSMSALGVPEGCVLTMLCSMSTDERVEGMRAATKMANRGELSSRAMMQVLVPVVWHYLSAPPSNVPNARRRGLATRKVARKVEIDAAACVIGAICSRVSWAHYSVLFKQMVRILVEPARVARLPDLANDADFLDAMEGIAVNVLVRILDSFHFFDGADDDDDDARPAPQSASEMLEHVPARKRTLNARIEQSLTETMLPTVQRYVRVGGKASSKRAKKQKEAKGYRHQRSPIRIVVIEALVRIYLLLPTRILRAQLPHLVSSVAVVMKSRDEDERMAARNALVRIVELLGPEYLRGVLTTLRSMLTRGYQLQVLGHSVHALLYSIVVAPSKRAAEPGCIDAALPTLSALLAADTFGEAAEKRKVEEIVKKWREARSCKSLDSYKLAAQVLTFPRQLSTLMQPIVDVLSSTSRKSRLAVCNEALGQIVAGLMRNESASAKQMLIAIYQLTDANLMDSDTSSANSSSSSTSNGKKSKLLLPRVDRGDKLRLMPEPRKAMDSDERPMEATRNRELLAHMALHLLNKMLRSRKLSAGSLEHRQLLDPFVALFLRALASRFDAIVMSALRSLNLLFGFRLPSMELHVTAMMGAVFELLRKARPRSKLQAACFSCISSIVDGYASVDLNSAQLKLLLTFALAELEQIEHQNDTFRLLGTVVRRKFLTPDIYDLSRRLAELMVQSETASVRSRCSTLLLDFLITYPLSAKRFRQHLDAIVRNLAYEYEAGREAVLDFFHRAMAKFAPPVLSEHAEYFFVALSLRLINDPSAECRRQVGAVIQQLVERADVGRRSRIVALVHKWLFEPRNMAMLRMAIQIVGLLCDALTSLTSALADDDDVDDDALAQSGATQLYGELLPFVGRLVACLRDADANFQRREDEESWQLHYMAIMAAEKTVLAFDAFNALAAERRRRRHKATTPIPDELWRRVAQLLSHRHPWIRVVSGRMLLHYCERLLDDADSASVVEARVADDPILGSESKLYFLFAQLVRQYFPPVFLPELADVNVKCMLVLSVLLLRVPSLRYRVKKARSQEMPIRDDKESASSATTQLSDDELEDDKRKEDEKADLLSSTVRRLSFMIRRERVGTPDVVALKKTSLVKFYGALLKQLHDKDDVQRMLVYILNPLYRLTKMELRAEEAPLAELAEQVIETARATAGPTAFGDVFNSIRDQVNRRRHERRRQRKLLALVDPAAKQAQAAKNREQQKRRRKRKIDKIKGPGTGVVRRGGLRTAEAIQSSSTDASASNHF
jgi:U3 small nucleolar RNA-associated protein 20, C-terminal/U3 small nucleolar RNA-associated protein 20, N-terminal